MQHHNLGYLFTVMIDNGFLGRQFVLPDEDAIKAFGISLTAVRGVIYKAQPTVYGMRVARVNLKTLPDTVFDYADIKALFDKNKGYFSTMAKPILGRVSVEGPYQYTQFSFFSHTEHEGCFNKHKVRIALLDDRLVHRGCTFKRVSIKDAIAAHHNLTPHLIDYLKTHFRGRGCNQLIEYGN